MGHRRKKNNKEDIIIMASKIPAAQNRLFKNIFVCKNCKHRMRVEPLKILGGKVRCRKCKKSDFRVVRKK